jgi:hypothetical protein
MRMNLVQHGAVANEVLSIPKLAKEGAKLQCSEAEPPVTIGTCRA